MSQQPADKPITWVTAEVLKALAHWTGMGALYEGCEFASYELQQQVEGTLTPEQRVHATTRLCALGFIGHRVEIVKDERVDVYTVTPDGAAAIEAARQGHVRKSGPKTTRGPKAADPTDFSARLWNLLRIRRMLTASEGARTLCDAGDEAEFERRRATARKCLRRWCNAGAVQESARRVDAAGHSNGDKRYVLVQDSVNPPRWRKPATKADTKACSAAAKARAQARRTVTPNGAAA